MTQQNKISSFWRNLLHWQIVILMHLCLNETNVKFTCLLAIVWRTRYQQLTFSSTWMNFIHCTCIGFVVRNRNTSYTTLLVPIYCHGGIVESRLTEYQFFGSRLNIRTSYQDINSHYTDKTFSRPYYLNNGNIYTFKVLYQDGPLLLVRNEHRSTTRGEWPKCVSCPFRRLIMYTPVHLMAPH